MLPNKTISFCSVVSFVRDLIGINSKQREKQPFFNQTKLNSARTSSSSQSPMKFMTFHIINPTLCHLKLYWVLRQLMRNLFTACFVVVYFFMCLRFVFNLPIDLEYWLTGANELWICHDLICILVNEH